MRRVVIRVGEVLLVLAILFLVFIGYGCFVDNRWYLLLVVTGGSMSPTFNTGDVILVTRPPEKIEAGMIVTFQVREKVVTHRVIEVAEGGCIRTKGDANDTGDVWADGEGQETQIRQVAGIYRARIPYLGYILTLPKRIPTGAWLSDVEVSSGNLIQAGTWHNPHPPTETPEPTEIPEPTETVEPIQEPTPGEAS